MRITESALRKQIRRIILESSESAGIYEGDEEGVTVISDPEEQFKKIQDVLGKYKGAFQKVFENVSKTENSDGMYIRVAAAFKIKPDGSATDVSWKFAPKPGVKYTEISETGKKSLLDGLTEKLSSIKFCAPNEKFSDTISIDEYPLTISVR